MYTVSPLEQVFITNKSDFQGSTLTLYPWTDYMISFGLSFLIYQMGMNIVPAYSRSKRTVIDIVIMPFTERWGLFPSSWIWADLWLLSPLEHTENYSLPVLRLAFKRAGNFCLLERLCGEVLRLNGEWKASWAQPSRYPHQDTQHMSKLT